MAIKADDINQAKPLQPLKLLLLDINMPIKNGFDTLGEVKRLYEKHNARLQQSNFSPLINSRLTNQRLLIMRPLIVFFSQFDRNQFTQFFTEDEQPEFYLEKPLAANQFASLLRIANIL